MANWTGEGHCWPDQANQTSRDWSKCYSCVKIGHAFIHLSKVNIKSFLEYYHMWTWVGYIYIWTKALEFTVQTLLGCMWHLPGSTGQAANYSMICTYLPSLLPTTLVLCYPRMEWPSSRMEWPSSRMGWPYNYIGRILLMLVTSSRCTSIPKTCCF